MGLCLRSGQAVREARAIPSPQKEEGRRGLARSGRRDVGGWILLAVYAEESCDRLFGGKKTCQRSSGCNFNTPEVQALGPRATQTILNSKACRRQGCTSSREGICGRCRALRADIPRHNSKHVCAFQPARRWHLSSKEFCSAVSSRTLRRDIGGSGQFRKAHDRSGRTTPRRAATRESRNHCSASSPGISARPFRS